MGKKYFGKFFKQRSLTDSSHPFMKYTFNRE